MRTEIRAPDLPCTPGELLAIEVEVANTASVIDGVTARVEGLDPSWVHLPVPILSLFPDATGVLPVHVNFPRNAAVGEYLVTIHVESTVDASRHQTQELWLQVSAAESATMRLRPSVVTKGSTARLAAVVSNTGNVQTDFTMAASDETRALECTVEPLTLTVRPEEDDEAEIGLRGRRPWFGQAVTRSVVVTARSSTVELHETATFNQKPRIPRGLLTIALLAAIVALWATILLVGVAVFRGQDRPTKAVPADFNDGGSQDVPLAAVAGSVTGKVTAAGTDDGLERITVEAFRVGRGGDTELTGSAATAEDGVYTLASLLPGTYTLRFTADGYTERWYPAAGSERGAEEVRLDPTAELDGIDMTLRGRPGTLVGTVALPDSADPTQPITVTVTQVVEQAALDIDTGGDGFDPPDPVVQETTGPISVEGLTTPATYRISAEAEGFEPQEFEETLAGGDTTVLNTIRLAAADGGIAGIVHASDGEPLGDVHVSVTSGEVQKEATTATSGNAGTFSVDGLETPRTYVLTFTHDDFGSETIALDLAAGEQRGGVTATLTGGTGEITGSVVDATGGPLGGIDVTVRGGVFEATTSTLTTAGAGADLGTYRVAGIPTPGVYTVTFSAEGVVSETRNVTFVEPAIEPDVSVALHRADAVITGQVDDGSGAVVGVTVELSDGTTTRSTTTASSPAGGYTFGGIEPGSYTLTFRADGHEERTVLVTVAAGDDTVHDVTLPRTEQGR